MMFRLVRMVAVVGASLAALPGTAVPTSARQSPPSAALAAARSALASTLPAAEARDLIAAYGETAAAAMWLDSAGAPGTQARAARVLLDRAGTDGLDPADYHVQELDRLAAGLDSSATSAARAAAAARFDTLLTASVLRYYRHLHLGRVDPRRLGLQLQVPADGHDFAVLLRGALASGRLTEAAESLTPQLFQYAALRHALSRYRRLADEQSALPSFSTTVRPGDRVAEQQLAALHGMLAATGDRPLDAAQPIGGVYDASAAAAVARFQQRHGLAPDGVIGPATQSALRVPLAWRVRQIELALERLRWMPDLSRGRLIAVNIPMFRLWAWNQVPSSGPPAVTMNVVVGRALDTRTPVFADEMEYLVFRPYWNVPASILRGEMLPAIRRDPKYLERQNLEIVAGPADSSPVLAPTAETLAGLGRTNTRLRQRPGPRNALGLVKFMFPNENDVYMHGTPAQELFGRARRDFSHGCIRLEDPTALAEWVLAESGDWSRDRVVAAMNGAPNSRVDLSRPVQVIIFYTTAVVQPENGLVHFAEDVYGQDGPLDRAL